ncbi:hypothetical protein P692DRAFT_20692998, partial [Suillus brevipes Sb2]
SRKVFVSYNVSFIESHQANHLPLHPGVILENSPVSDDNTESPAPSSQRTSVEDAPDIDDPSPPRRPTRVAIPSERIRAAKDIPYTTSTQRAVIESMAAADRLRAKKQLPSTLPDEATLAAMVSEDGLVHLAEIFAAV